MECSPQCIVIDHRNDQNCDSGVSVKQNSLNDSESDIKIIVDNIVFNTHKQILESIGRRRRLVMSKISSDDTRDIYVISGVKAKPFETLLLYLYDRYVNCDHKSGIELLSTLIKLNFIALAKEIAIKYNYHCDVRCVQCGHRLTIDNCDQIYDIARHPDIDFYPLIAKCRIFIANNGEKICKEYLYDNCQKNDDINSITIKFLTPRYCNYIEFLIPHKFAIYFNIMISMDRQNWTKIVDNDNIACVSWNWFYFKETRVKYIRITCVSVDTEGVETPFDIRRHFDGEAFFCKLVNHPSYPKFDPRTNYLIPTHNAIQYPVKDTKHYFSENLFTYCMSKASAEMKHTYYYYHFIGDGQSLHFYLPQTCYVNAIRFRLWDMDDRTYDYSVRVRNESNDKHDWHLIGSYHNRSSWQTVEFARYLPVRWISITGLKGPDYDREFAVIDFECPPQDIIYRNKCLISNNNFYYDRCL